MNMTFADVPEPVFSSNTIDTWLSHVTASVRAEDAAPEVIAVGTPHVPLLFIGMDPGSNGRGSDTACIALMFTYRVIVAEPATQLPPAERRSTLDYHCTVRVVGVSFLSTLCVKSPTVTTRTNSRAAVGSSCAPAHASRNAETCCWSRGMKQTRAARDGARTRSAPCAAKQKQRATSESQSVRRTRARAQAVRTERGGASTSSPAAAVAAAARCNATGAAPITSAHVGGDVRCRVSDSHAGKDAAWRE